MSENTDHCQLATTTVVSSPSTNNNTKRIFLSTSSQFSIIHNESFTPSLHAVRERKNVLYGWTSFFLFTKVKEQIKSGVIIYSISFFLFFFALF